MSQGVQGFMIVVKILALSFVVSLVFTVGWHLLYASRGWKDPPSD